MSDDQGSASDGGATNQAYCADLVRRTDFGRYAAALFLTPEQRRATLALHAFDIEINQVRGHVSQALAGEIRLQWWSDVLMAMARGDVDRSPVAAELTRVVQAFPQTVERLNAAIEAHRFDLYEEPMLSLDALEDYLAQAFAVPYMADGQDAELMKSVSVATGLVAMIERLPLHASRQQLYLPLDTVEQCGVRDEDLFGGVATPAISTLVISIAERAGEQLRSAMALLEQSPAASRRAFLGLALIPRKLRAITDTGYAPFAPDIRSSNLTTLWTLWRASRRAPFKV